MPELCQGLLVNALRAEIYGVEATPNSHALRAESTGSRRPRPLWMVLAREIMLCLHLYQAAGGALKFGLQSFTAVQRPRRRRGRNHDLDAAIVEFVDQHDEAARGILIGRSEYRDVRNENRVVRARELDVVVLAARTFAQFAEFEPRHAGAGGHRGDVPVFDRQHPGARGGVAGERCETGLQL